MSGIVGGINLRSSGLVNLGSASDGTVFTGTGAGLPVGFESAAGGGAWTFISSATASTSSSIDFTSGIDSTYDMYIFVLSDVSCPAGERLWIRTGAGSFDTVSTDYAFHQILVKDNSTSYQAYASTARSHLAVGSSDGGTGAKHLNGTVSMYNPAGTTFRKLFNYDTVQTGSGNRSYSNTGQGMRDSTAAITEVRFMADSGNILNGVFYLYGLSKS